MKDMGCLSGGKGGAGQRRADAAVWLNLGAKGARLGSPPDSLPALPTYPGGKVLSLKANLPWEPNRQTVRVRAVNYFEVEVKEIVLEREAAERLALERANIQFAEVRAAVSEPVQEDQDILPVEDPNQVRVRVRLEAIEEIGQEKLFSYP